MMDLISALDWELGCVSWLLVCVSILSVVKKRNSRNSYKYQKNKNKVIMSYKKQQKVRDLILIGYGVFASVITAAICWLIVKL